MAMALSCSRSAVRWCRITVRDLPSAMASTTGASSCRMAAEQVATVPTVDAERCSWASGISSANTSQSMQPAGNPIASGSTPVQSPAA